MAYESHVICIGRSANRSPTYYYQGKVDEVIIDNTAWSDAEIIKYYCNSKGQFYGQVCMP